MQIITVITQAMDMARRKFSRGEQLMLIDIFNGTALTPGILGQHLIAQVEDSFALYPGMYEEKWEVDQKQMLEKIVSLTPWETIFLELWAVGFWALGKEDALDAYVAGRINLSIRLTDVIARLDSVSEMLEKTKSAFKSAAIAEARDIVEESSGILSGMI